MNGKTSSSVVIVPRAMDRSLLEDAVQAKLHMEYILGVNDDPNIEPGQLHGMSLMLKNAQKAYAEAQAALPGIHYTPPRNDAPLVWEADCPELQPSH